MYYYPKKSNAPSVWYNDMWRYNPTTNNWTWMSGTNVGNDNGAYDSLCTAELNYAPTARSENRAKWKDTCDNFLFYGGSEDNNFNIMFNDLWSFNPSTLKWVILNGGGSASTNPIYGTKGIASATNTPGRRAGSVGWRDRNGDLYLFGGTVNGWPLPRNDMWKYVIDTSCLSLDCTKQCSLSAITISADQTVFCASDSTQICAPFGFSTYLWNTGANTRCISTALAGNYYVTVSDNNNCSAVSNHLSIAVYPLPPVSISVNGDTLMAYNGVTYQWYINGIEINGATSNFYIVNQTGSYSVAITDINGCVAVSLPIVFSGIPHINDKYKISIYPNPATNQLNVEIDAALIGAQLNIYDVTGALVQSAVLQIQNSKFAIQNFSSGVYIAEIKTKEASVKKRWVKM